MSVVICAYTERRWAQLRRAVSSAHSQTNPPLEVIVVIDHNPALADMARDELDARVIENRGSQGLSDARNTGIAAAAGDVIAFLDDDAHADAGWLEHLVEAMSDPRVHVVGGRADAEWEAGRPRWFPESFDWVVGCSYEGLPSEAAPVRNVIGCNMAFRRNVFNDVGGFSPDMGRVGTRPLGCEETELCIRVGERHGWGSVRYEPAAAVLHSVSVDRGTWHYFLSRCYYEGISKAAVARLRGAESGLASERSHVAAVLPRAAWRALTDFVTLRDSQGLLRAAAIVLGVAMAGAGYVRGSVVRSRSGARPSQPAMLGAR